MAAQDDLKSRMRENRKYGSVREAGGIKHGLAAICHKVERRIRTEIVALNLLLLPLLDTDIVT